MNVDLHTHTTASDGDLSPNELLRRARDNGVQMLSITDHDTVAAYDLIDESLTDGINLVTGIELSCRWGGREVHVVGLNIDAGSDAIRAATLSQQASRTRRAEHIANKLERQGVSGSLLHAETLANGTSIGRPHFARHLVQAGHARDVSQAFKKFLSDSKLGNLKQFWPDLPDVVSWILDAGGTAVLAHPAHYKLTHSKLRCLLEDFVAAHGTAIEVISGRQPEHVGRQLSDAAQALNLYASAGSDFHRPGTYWADVGGCAPLPPGCTPVWDAW